MVKNKKNLCFTASVEHGMPMFDPDFMYYLCYGFEIGDKTNYHHYQGYVQLKEEMDFNDLHKILHPTAKFIISRGSVAQAIDYTKKDGKWQEFGQVRKQGQRCDLEKVREDIDNGATALDIARAGFGTWCRNYKAFALYADMVGPSSFKRDPTIVFLQGPPGTGKTTKVQELYPYAYMKAPGHPWWNGYYGQEEVIMDEFRSDTIKPCDLLAMISPAPYQHNIKGSCVWSRIQTLVIVSNYSFENLFGHLDQTTQKAILRRISKTLCLMKLGGEVIVLPSPTSPLPPYGSKEYYTLPMVVNQSMDIVDCDEI